MLSVSAWSQNTISIAGTVMDESGEPLIGVSVQVKGTSIGMVTDLDGRFRLNKVPTNATLVYFYTGYKKLEKKYGEKSRERENIALETLKSDLDEVVVTGRSNERKVSVTGAITTVRAEDLQVPASSVTNMLGGRVPGIIAVTRSGEPGSDFSDFWVRGISTFGAKQGALVLIDGVEGNLNDLDPQDIESFSILKDASATAVYGVRGANGVVVVTTKRGQAGDLRINFKTNLTYSYSPRMPEYADAYEYAQLANEARVVRDQDPIYTPTELSIFKNNLDPDLYPNVNWRDVILKDYVLNPSYHLNISGGGQNARYYMSFGYQQNEGVFKQDKNVQHNNTNVSYNKYNFRGNINANITRTTQVSLNLETTFTTQSAPGLGTDNNALWSAQANLPPVIVPVIYSNGQLPTYGTNADQMSPYVRLNYTGYTENERYTTRTIASVRQDLKMITPGLSVSGLFSLTTNGRHITQRSKNPDLWYADPKEGRNLDGSLRTIRKITKKDLTVSQISNASREYYMEARVDYSRVFGDHRVSGMLHFYRQESKSSDWSADMLSVLPMRYQALSGRVTYSYKDTYFIEGNLGYTGSENFAKGNRYGLFPAISAGWVPTQYKWIQEKVPFINYLKLRGSYGEVGNDRLNVRFPYLTIIGNTGSGTWGGTGIGETTTGASDMQWETSKKLNLGIDAKFWKNRFDLTVDFYRNKTSGIFQQRANIPDEIGMTNVLPYSNIGEMTSWGFDGTLAYTQRLPRDMSFTLRGNMTLARNKINYWEQTYTYPYQSYSNTPYGVYRGLIALGLFKDEEDIRSSPTQTYMSDVRPGDIKYKDVNADGQINDDDIVPLSYSSIPNIQYGFALEYTWKNFTISALFEGVTEVEYFYGGTGYYPFAWGSTGNVLKIATDPKNRWIPESYSGTKETENPKARFPRLTYGENKNNNRASTFWLANGEYIRLKNVQVTWRLPRKWFFGTPIKGVTLSLIGDNLHVWDKVKLWDPGQASANGSVYPMQRRYTAQLIVNF